MRKKTIAAFAAVYIAICLTCGAVNGINFPNSDDSSAIAVTESTKAQTTTTEQQTQSTNGRKSKRSKTASDGSQDESETEKKEDETQIEEQTQASDAPSLEEYLSKLRCGGCGHNCSLANPRCMRGARKQSTAKSEYSELYG